MNTRQLGPAALLALAVATAGCDGADLPNVPAPIPPLDAATWHAHGAMGQPMPALVAHRAVEGRLERTFLDAAELEILAGGRWELRASLQIWREGRWAADQARLDHGTWEGAEEGYRFRSATGDGRFTIRDPAADSLVIHLAIPGVPGLTTTTLRRASAPPLPSGGWTAARVRDRPMPDVLHRFDPDTVEGGRVVSIHLVVDSAKLELAPTGSYVHAIFASEWEGAPGGPPERRRFRHRYGDHGSWRREGAAIRLESGWLQNHRMEGALGADGVLRVRHGLTHGDEPAEFGYARW
jgi:hypothetical protein